MEYNTQLEPLKIREYGRNVLRMVKHAMSIEDRKERTKAAETIIKVMAQINPDENKRSAEHEQKLWDHLYIMSNYSLDVDTKFDMPEKNQEINKIEAKPDYPKGRIRYRHYGKIVDQLIRVTKNEKDPEKRERMEQYLGAYMKLAYKAWSEQKMSDEVIIDNIRDMSNGEIEMKEIIDITDATPINVPMGANQRINQSSNRKKKKKRKRKQR